MSGIRSNLTISAFGKDGHPQLQVNGCSVDILNLNLSLGGGVIQWIINLVFLLDLNECLNLFLVQKRLKPCGQECNQSAGEKMSF